MEQKPVPKKLSDFSHRTQLIGAAAAILLSGGSATTFALWAARMHIDETFATDAEMLEFAAVAERNAVTARQNAESLSELSSVVLNLNVTVLDIQIADAEADIAVLQAKSQRTSAEEAYLRSRLRKLHDLQVQREKLFNLLIDDR